jgi:uncharacterized cupredoxin-like copper-binding protein
MMERTRAIIRGTPPALLALGAVAAFVAAGPAALGAGRTHAAASAAKLTTTTIAVSAGKPSELSFKLSKFSLVPAGKVIFKVTNRGKIVHDFKLCTTRTATSAKNTCVGKVTRRISPGQSRTLTVTLLKKGKYEFLCTVPGHAGAGMKGLVGIGVRVTAPTTVATSSPAPTATTATTTTTPTTPTATTTPTTTTTPANATCNSPRSSTATVSALECGYTVSPSTLPCGTVAFTITNNGDVQHDFQIEGLLGGGSVLLGPGEKATLTVKITPGTWTYFCSYANHRAAGMEGKLTVTG